MITFLAIIVAMFMAYTIAKAFLSQDGQIKAVTKASKPKYWVMVTPEAAHYTRLEPDRYDLHDKLSFMMQLEALRKQAEIKEA